jgi:hypothetical protein
MNEDLDEMAAAEPLAGEELERLMARYARVRLDPSQAQARRARAAVMEAAWRRRIDAAVTITGSGRRWPVRRAPFAGWTLRRLAVSMSAAVLGGLMLGTSAFAASRAGGPLYEARVAIEALALPTDPATRVEVQLERAQTRLAEAVEAAGHGDDAATAAALEAYDEIITDLEAMEGAPAARALEAVRFHRSILLGIAASAPAGAANGLGRAIANSDRVIAALETPGPGTGAGQPGGNDNPGAKPSTGPAATDRPEKTKAPTATDRPEKTKAPTATDKPGRTPPPRKTPDPAGSGDEDGDEDGDQQGPKP